MVTKNLRNAKFEEKKKSTRRRSIMSSDYSGNVPTNLSESYSGQSLDLECKRSNANIKPIIDHGKNLTPKDLYTGKAHTKHGTVKLTDLDHAKDNDFKSMTSVFNGPNSRISANSIGGGSSIFGRSLLDSSMRRMSVTNKSLMSLGSPSTLISNASLLSSFHSDNLTPTNSQHSNLSSLQSSTISLLNKKETPKLSEEELKKNIEYNLTETDTEIIFKVIGTAVEENENLEQVKEQNDRYDKILKEAGPGNEKYVARAMLTFNNALKHKEAETDKIDRIDTANQVSNSAIWDAFNSQTEEDDFFKEEEPELVPQAQVPADQATSNTSSTTSESSGSFNLSSTGNLVQRRPKIVDKHDIKIRHDAILNSPNLFSKLLLMERVISQNIHQSQLSRYRSLVPLDQNGNRTYDESDMTDFDHGLIRLWSFKDAQLKGFNVNSIAFNRVNPDIVAVGYGHSQRAKGASKSPGLVCVWSMRNLEYPERIFHLQDSVTAVDFSSASPNLLAVGLANGTILIYNITRNKDEPIVDSVDSESKHLGVVWSLKWTERERGTEEKKEVLISTSSDGTVVQWTIRKGFESIILIKVKRTSSNKKLKKDRKTDNAVISQLSPATSFNFHPTDGNTYLVGTEEGLIHRCSCSYNEQTLDSYTGHRGQVYGVQWHPTIPNIFISCSEDWSIRLWHQRRYDEPITSIQCSQKPIRAVQWSPYSPNIAASISADAIDIWDLSISTLDPIFSLPVASGLFLTCIAFSPTSNSILVGDSEGSVAIYQLKGFKNAPEQDLIDFIQSVVGNKIMY